MSYFRNCNVIVFALALYSLRLLGYSFIESASQSLFLEVCDFIFLSLCFLDGSLNLLFLIQVLKPFGNSLLVIAAMTYAKNNASIETMASLEVKLMLYRLQQRIQYVFVSQSCLMVSTWVQNCLLSSRVSIRVPSKAF